jgi:hypothetical protein
MSIAVPLVRSMTPEHLADLTQASASFRDFRRQVTAVQATICENAACLVTEPPRSDTSGTSHIRSTSSRLHVQIIPNQRWCSDASRARHALPFRMPRAGWPSQNIVRNRQNHLFLSAVIPELRTIENQ